MLQVFFFSLLASSALAETVCYPPCGCFGDQRPWNKHKTPMSWEDQNLEFNLYTQSNPDDGIIISWDDIPSVYDATKPTTFLIHGWLSAPGMFSNLDNIKDAYLDKGYDYNIITVDWSGGSRQIYEKARSNIRVIGACVGHLADTLDTDMSLIHCVGHSLGGQTCGYVGEYVNDLIGRETLGRITGMDPAAEEFDTDELEVRLDPGDADFVDVIHTNCKGFGLLWVLAYWGTPIPSGHVDFYPHNCGRQPACIIPSDICDHVLATSYYMASVKESGDGDCEFLACPIKDQLKDSCNPSKDCDPGTTCQSMGFNAINYPGRGIYYLEPTIFDPYCPKT